MHIANPQFAVGERTKGVHQARFPFADGFYFGAIQYDTRGETLNQFVIERGAFIFYVYFYIGMHKVLLNIQR